MRDTDPNEAVDFIIKNAKKIASARSDRIYLEEFRKSKKALLMARFVDQSIAAQERDAYAHPEYLQVLEALKTAVAIEEELRWQMIAAQARVEVWRTQSANERLQDRATL